MPDLRRGDRFEGGRVERVDRVLRFAVMAPEAADGRSRAAARSDVRYVEADPILPLAVATPDDARFSEQYGPQQVRAPAAWNTTFGSTTRNVCVVDTGVRYTHEDLAGARWLGGHDYVNQDTDPWDDNGHGTHVAGIAAATAQNVVGIAGVAQAGILAAKVLDQGGFGSWTNVASGIRWCADNGGHVINLSLAGGGGSTALLDAVRYATNTAGSLVVAATGNGSCNNCVAYPAKYAEVVAVGCTTVQKASCSFTSKGTELELVGPGSQVLSTWASSDNAYASLSGTSMSSPHVAGVAALVWSVAPTQTNVAIRKALQTTAGDLGATGKEKVFGYGLVNAFAALRAVQGLPQPTESATLSYGFDDGALPTGWTKTGLWHVGSTCESPPSPSHYLGYTSAATCTYETGATTTGAVTFSVDLTQSVSASVAFDHRRSVEPAALRSGQWDLHRVDLSVDGKSWTALVSLTSKSPVGGGGWERHIRSLGGYAGSNVKLRFFFNSKDATYNGYLGWLIDNVDILTATV